MPKSGRILNFVYKIESLETVTGGGDVYKHREIPSATISIEFPLAKFINGLTAFEFIPCASFDEFSIADHKSQL